MPIQHAVLSLLSDRPSHGYELKTAFEQAVGPQWGPLNIGHLYQVLDRLSREGMVTSTRVPQEARPDRVVYAITDAGVADLRAWMSEPTRRNTVYRDDFVLKMVAAVRTGDAGVVEQVLARQRGFLLGELRTLHEHRRHSGDGMVGLLLSAAARRVEADLAFLDEALVTLVPKDGSTTSESTVESAGTGEEAADGSPTT
jgi:DNA-binding PadR family transcriptional regulator